MSSNSKAIIPFKSTNMKSMKTLSSQKSSIPRNTSNSKQIDKSENSLTNNRIFDYKSKHINRNRVLMRHKKTGSTITGSNSRFFESQNSLSKSRKINKKDIQKYKLTKEIMKRLQRRSITKHSLDFGSISSDKSRMNKLKTHQNASTDLANMNMIFTKM